MIDVEDHSKDRKNDYIAETDPGYAADKQTTSLVKMNFIETHLVFML